MLQPIVVFYSIFFLHFEGLIVVPFNPTAIGFFHLGGGRESGVVVCSTNWKMNGLLYVAV